MPDFFKLFREYKNKLVHSPSRTANASRQIVYSFILKGISILVGLIYVPLLLNYLSVEKYGIWLTLVSILGWFSFFDIGLGNGLRNKLAETKAKGDLTQSRKYVSTTYALLICIFSIVLIIFNISNYFLNWNLILNTKTISNHELYILTSIVLTFFILRFIVQLIGVIYLADQKPSVSSAVPTLSNLISLLIVFILAKTTEGGDLVLLGSVISILPVLLFILLSVYSFNNRYAFLKPSLSKVDFSLSKSLLNLGVKFFLMQVTVIVVFSTSNLFIAQFYGASEVVVYNIVFKYFQVPVMVFSIILAPLWSATTDAFVRSDYVWLKVTMRRLNILSLVFGIGIILMVIISNYIFKIWIGDKVNIPFNITLFMAIYAMINVFVAPFSSFINGTGKIQLTMSLTLIGIPLYFIAIFFSSKLFNDSSGIILAIIITSLIGAIIQPIQSYKILSRTAKGIWFK